MLAVAVSPHGLTAIRLNEATLSQELCTVGLLQPHILVEYQWQNIGLCHEKFKHNKRTSDFVSRLRQNLIRL